MTITGVVDSIAHFLGSIKSTVAKWGQKFGLGFIAGGVQSTISVAVVAFAVTFFGFVIFFISQMYSAFRNLITYISTMSAGGASGQCFLNLLHASGIASGVSMAMPFMMTVLVFYFGYALYKVTSGVLKTISDESSKTIEAYD